MLDEDFDEVFVVNFCLVFVVCRGVVCMMMCGWWGWIINISLVMGFVGNLGQVNYVVVKVGVIGMIKIIVKELGLKGIMVNVVVFGFIGIDMIEVLGEQVFVEVLKWIFLRRLGILEEVVVVVFYFVLEEGGYVMGQVLMVDGGFVC